MDVVKRDGVKLFFNSARQMMVTHSHPLRRDIQEELQVTLELMELSLWVTTATWMNVMWYGL